MGRVATNEISNHFERRVVGRCPVLYIRDIRGVAPRSVTRRRLRSAPLPSGSDALQDPHASRRVALQMSASCRRYCTPWRDGSREWRPTRCCSH